MMGKTHKLGGFTSGFIMLSTPIVLPKVGQNPIIAIPFMAGCVFGAYWPDIDDIRSTVGRKLWFISWVYFLIQKIVGFFIRNPKNRILKNIKRSVNHRGLAHWPILYFIGLIILFTFFLLKDIPYKLNFTTIKNTINGLISYKELINIFVISIIGNFLYGFFIGALSHIILDSFNVTGIALFAPFSFKRISFANIDTSDKKQELKFRAFMKFLTVVSCVFCLFMWTNKIINYQSIF